MIVVRDLHKIFARGNVRAVNGVDLDVARGEVVVMTVPEQEPPRTFAPSTLALTVVFEEVPAVAPARRS